LSLSELLWAFAVGNFSLWVLYKLINQQLFSDKITRFQILATLIATISFCSIGWWEQLFIHRRRYIETSKINMLNSPFLFKGITGLMTIIFFVSLFLFLFNVAIGLLRKFKRGRIGVDHKASSW
jgi:hypothetical protein